MKLRMKITKGEQIRYISHLDYARTIERSLRRAKLPVAYSEGFNPHMKMAFASALSVGVTSRAEYIDVELTHQVLIRDVIARLTESLPQGIRIISAKYIDEKAKSLMAIVNQAEYIISLTLHESIRESIDKFNTADTVPYTKHTPKGQRAVDIKQYIIGKLKFSSVGITMHILITPGGSIKPSEVITVLTNEFGLQGDDAKICRTGLYINSKGKLLTPFEVLT